MKVTRLGKKMRELGFMAEDVGKRAKVRGWVGRQSARIQVFLLLRAKELPEPATTRKRQELSHDRVHPWTDVHSWYAVMGGFAFEDSSTEGDQFMPGDRQRVTLTDKAVVWLAKNQAQSLPDISSKYIEDRSKSGGLGKFLTCWQAFFFCVQSVFRLLGRSSITLLELNVSAHALCALLVLWIWWDKPQDVQEPTLITDKDGLDVCAYLCLKSEKLYSKSLDWELPVRLGRIWIPCEPCSDCWEISRSTTISTYYQRPAQVSWSADGVANFHRPLLGPLRQPCLKVSDTFWAIGTLRYHGLEGRRYIIDGRDIKRLARAYGLANEFGNVDDYRSPTVVDRCADIDRESLENFLRSVNCADLDEIFPEIFWFYRDLARFTLAGGCYGGLHLAAWACQFPSYAETVLWRAASVTIMATGPIIIMLVLQLGVLNTTLSTIDLRWIQSERFGNAKNAARVPLVSLWTAWYVLCRAFIVVECFIMLAHLPDTALEIPRWAAYIPHIT